MESINNLRTFAEQVYKKGSFDGQYHYYQILKSKNPKIIGEFVTNLVVDAHLQSQTRTLVLDSDNNVLAKNFSIGEKP